MTQREYGEVDILFIKGIVIVVWCVLLLVMVSVLELWEYFFVTPNLSFQFNQPTAKGQTNYKQISIVCFPTYSPTWMFVWNWCAF